MGCCVGSRFVGALAYADDIVLLAPTSSAMRRMLDLCQAYASDYFINFNASKSKCLAIIPRSQQYVSSYLQDNIFLLEVM